MAENAMICGKNLVRHIERVSKDVLRDLKETENQIRKVGSGMKISKQ